MNRPASILKTVLCSALLLAFASSAPAATHYVAIASTNPVSPFITWDTAATNIQDAIDVSTNGETVLVSNGVYATGGRAVNGWLLTNRVVITNNINVRSTGGPTVTSIVGAAVPLTTNGDAAVRCVYVGVGAYLASLSGFTLTNGHTRLIGDSIQEDSGGGILCGTSGELVSNCVISGNSAAWHGGGSQKGWLNNCTISGNWANYAGGGASDGTLTNCMVSGNSAGHYGGGCDGCTLNNCTIVGNKTTLSGSQGGGAIGGTLNNCVVTGNSANYTGGGVNDGHHFNCLIISNYAGYTGGGSYGAIMNNCTLSQNSAKLYGGGSYFCNLYNCIVYFNSAPTNANYAGLLDATYCCMAPFLAGTGNIASDPQFVNVAATNYQLLASSPCIDRGSNAYATNSTGDVVRNPRIMYGVADIGAYEFQSAAGYWQWAGAITNGLTNFNQSATGGGYPNLLKYATGSSATNSDSLAAMNGTQTSNGFLALTFNRNTNANDVTLIAESSSNVTNGAPWRGIATNFNGSWGGATNVTESGTGTPVVVIVSDTATPATNRFLRLRVTRP